MLIFGDSFTPSEYLSWGLGLVLAGPRERPPGSFYVLFVEVGMVFPWFLYVYEETVLRNLQASTHAPFLNPFIGQSYCNWHSVFVHEASVFSSLVGDTSAVELLDPQYSSKEL